MVRYFLLIIMTFSIHSLFAQSKKSKWTVDDIMNTEYLRSASFSPDNTMIVWTKKRASKKKDRFVSDIYLSRINAKKDGKYRTVRLTNAEESDYAPFFSKDGEQIYFRSSRDKGNKLWALSIYGGEPEKVHEFKDGLSNIQWMSDSTFSFTASEGKSLYETQVKEKKDNTIVVEDSAHWEPSRIFSFSLKDKKIKRLTNNKYPIRQYKMAHNSQWLLYSVARSLHYDTDAQPAAYYYLKNLTTGKTTRILDGLQTPYSFEFTETDGGFYFVSTHASDIKWAGAGAQFLYYYDLDKMAYEQVPLEWENGLGGSFYVLGEDIIANLANGATSKLAFYKKKGHQWTHQTIDLGAKNEHIVLLDVSDDYSKVLYEHSTASQLPVNYIATLKKKDNHLIFDQEDTLITSIKD